MPIPKVITGLQNIMTYIENTNGLEGKADNNF